MHLKYCGAAAVVGGALLFAFQPEASAFLEKPYLQLGDAPEAADRLQVLWQTADRDASWSLRYRERDADPWQVAPAPRMRRVALPGVSAHRIWRVDLAGLTPGVAFTYEVQREGKTEFSASARARKSRDQAQQFVVFGDCGANTSGQRAVAFHAYKTDPDFVMIPGDIVYSSGRISEYRSKFFPIYNADEASPRTGAPLLRSHFFIAAPGNHDLLRRDLRSVPDILAYYLYWSQPLNGPAFTESDPNLPALEATPQQAAAFLSAAGDAYPRMASFSFDYGGAHWTVLDSNPYIDWETPALVDWVKKDLAAAKDATWRFVAFHHPGFNSAKSHFGDQWMRVLSPVFEKGGVDVVFAGHVHNYQRTLPMTAVPKRRDGRRVDAEWTLDKQFDGVRNTQPRGIIYLVTGAGGANLYNREQQNDPSSWQPFTAKFIADRHSFTNVQIGGRKLSAQQVGNDGKVIDQFVITK